jgi:hypothetical protein
MKKHLSFLVGIFIHPRETIKTIANEGSVVSAAIISLSMCFWIIWSEEAINNIWDRGGFLVNSIGEYLDVFVLLPINIFFIIIIVLLVGYGIMSLVSFLFKKDKKYLKLLTVGGYLTIAGIPFGGSFIHEATHTYPQLTLDSLFIGLPYPVFYLLNEVLRSSYPVILYTENSLRFIGLSLNSIYFLWIIFLSMFAVRVIYKLSISNSFLVVIISSLVFAMILWIIYQRPIWSGQFHMILL